MEDTEKYYREHIIPAIIDTSKFDIWSVECVAGGIEDFTDASSKKRWKIQLVSPDHRIEICLWANATIQTK